jgi:hypothetical protein
LTARRAGANLTVTEIAPGEGKLWISA